MSTVVFIVVIIVILLAVMFFVPQWRLKRAISQVLRILREHNAVDAKSARTIDELGLRPRGMLEGLLKGRDYKQYALNALMKAEIVQMSADGRVFLLEDKLIGSGLDRGSPYSRLG